jgi:hypothetical protein
MKIRTIESVKKDNDFFIHLIVAPFLSAVIYNIVGKWFGETKVTKKALSKEEIKEALGGLDEKLVDEIIKEVD